MYFFNIHETAGTMILVKKLWAESLDTSISRSLFSFFASRSLHRGNCFQPNAVSSIRVRRECNITRHDCAASHEVLVVNVMPPPHILYLILEVFIRVFIPVFALFLAVVLSNPVSRSSIRQDRSAWTRNRTRYLLVCGK